MDIKQPTGEKLNPTKPFLSNLMTYSTVADIAKVKVTYFQYKFNSNKNFKPYISRLILNNTDGYFRNQIRRRKPKNIIGIL